MGLFGNERPLSVTALGATGGARIAFGAVGTLGLCRVGDVLNECVRRGPLGAEGGGEPDLGRAASVRALRASFSTGGMCDDTVPVLTAFPSTDFDDVRVDFGDSGKFCMVVEW